MLVHWHEDFEVGHAQSDGEHRHVVDLLNELDLCLASGAVAAVVDRALGRLVAAVEMHFRHEEIESIDAVHQAEHDELLGRVLQLHDDWRAGVRMLDRQILINLARWWLTHVRAHDAGEGVLIH
ncbi:MAG: hypothetical protein H7Y60_05745 [Rhodospirillaceae bacterium]|nr:hypothetical protein [Rhodospirillales bacterium]